MSFDSASFGSQNISTKNLFSGNEVIGTCFLSATGTQFVIPVFTTGTSVSSVGAIGYTASVNGYTGAMYFNSGDSKIYVSNGSAWIRTSALS